MEQNIDSRKGQKWAFLVQRNKINPVQGALFPDFGPTIFPCNFVIFFDHAP